MMRRAKRWGGGLLVTGLAGASLLALVTGLDRATANQALKNNNLTGLRSEALALFPRGSRLEDAATRLAHIGFACEPVAHPLPDISGPSLRCASNGRGYPDFPAVTVILLTRNGMISDVDVWNIMAKADGEADDIDFTATGASDALPAQLRRPEAPAAAKQEVAASNS